MYLRLTRPRIAWLGFLTVVAAASVTAAPPPSIWLPPGANSAQAQTVADTLSYSQALSRALEASPDIRARALTSRAASAEARQAGRLPNPVLGTEIENLSSTGMDRPIVTIGVEQVFLLGGDRRARRRLAAGARDEAMANEAQVRAGVSAGVLLRFARVAAAQSSLEVTETSRVLAARVLDATAEQVSAGDRSPVDEIRADIVLAGAVADVAKARAHLGAARESLASLWAGPPDFDVVGATPPPAPLPVLAVLLEALPESAHLASWNAVLDQHQAAIGLEKARRIPDVTASLGYRRFDLTGDRAAVVSFSFPLPVFDANSNGIKAARLTLESAESARNAALQKARVEIAEAYAKAAASWIDLLSLRDEVIPKAETVAVLLEEGYRAGKFGLIDLLDAQRTLALARSRFHSALGDYHAASAIVERLTTPSSPRRDSK